MYNKEKTFIEPNKEGTYDIKEDWTLDSDGFIWDADGRPVHSTSNTNTGQIMQAQIINPEDPSDTHTIYTTAGKSVGQAAEQYLEQMHDKSMWSEEFIELKVKIQPVVLKRLIEDDIMSRYNTFTKGVDDDHGPFAEDLDRSESIWGDGKLSEQQWWVWDWFMEALKNAKEELQFSYDKDTLFGKANVNWLPMEEEIVENGVSPSDADS